MIALLWLAITFMWGLMCGLAYANYRFKQLIRQCEDEDDQ